VPQPLTPDGPYGRFASALLSDELPDLPAESRVATVAFVCRRAEVLPSPLRLGVTALVAATGVVARLVGSARVHRFLRTTSLPLVGELARMVRSLGFAYVWETWPDTSPTGAPPVEATP
jgi:hypothetical protein